MVRVQQLQRIFCRAACYLSVSGMANRPINHYCTQQHSSATCHEALPLAHLRSVFSVHSTNSAKVPDSSLPTLPDPAPTKPIITG